MKIDLTKPLTITVTQKDIDRATRLIEQASGTLRSEWSKPCQAIASEYTIGSCPIAQAVKRAVKTTRVETRQTFLTVKTVHFNLPVKAQRFISCYDHGKTVKPFTFTATPTP